MKTKKLIIEMLKENTGKHFLDSGSIYGRHWEENQSVNFEKTDPVTWEIWNGEISFTISTFHYLTNVLDYDSICTRLNQLIKRNDIHWTGEFIDYFNENSEFIHKGEQYEVSIGPEINTYNYENYLSQILQFVLFEVWGPFGPDKYVGLQIHNGCDARGGYTGIKVFKLEGYLTGSPDVFGDVNGRNVSTWHNGYSLTFEDDNEPVTVNEDEENEIYLTFNPDSDPNDF